MGFIQFGNPWGLLALAAVPAIIVIHLYHRRFPPLMIAGLHLWSSDIRQPLPGRRREKLPLSTSLLLELLAAVLLALALSQPRMQLGNPAVHLVAVLDDSASMQARAPGGKEPSAREAAVAELRRRFEILPRGSVFTVIRTGVRPTLLAGPEAPWRDVEQQLAGWKPSAARHAFDPAWDTARGLVEHSGQLLFLTDRMPDPATLPAKMEVLAFGRRLENVALTSARWTLDPSSADGLLYARVYNLGKKPASVEVQVRHGTQVLHRETLQLAPRQASPLSIRVPGGLGGVQLRAMSATDGLPLDDFAELVEPQARRVSVATALPAGDVARQYERVLHALPGVQQGGAEQAHLKIAPAHELPAPNVVQWWLGVGPLDPAPTAREASVDLLGPYAIDGHDPLMQEVKLAGVIFGGVQRPRTALAPLVSAGKYPLIYLLNGTRAPSYVLNYEPARSNLAESPDFPILLSNLVELRRDALPGLQRWTYRVGEEPEFRLFEGVDDPTPASTLTLISGERTKPLPRRPVVNLPPIEAPGVYEIRAGEQVFGRFAVNFEDPEESDLSDLAPGQHLAQRVNERIDTRLDSAYSWLIRVGLLVLVAVVLADWFVLRHPRTA